MQRHHPKLCKSLWHKPPEGTSSTMRRFLCMFRGVFVAVFTFQSRYSSLTNSSAQFQYVQSEQNIILDPEIGGTPQSNYQSILESDYESCAKHARSAATCLDAYANEEKEPHGGNCGFGANIDELCRYCNNSSKSSTTADATCCDHADAATRCRNVVIYPPVQPPLPFSTLSNSSATVTLNGTRPSETDHAVNADGHNKSSADNAGDSHFRKDGVAGIVIACIAASVLLLAVLAMCCRRKRQRRQEELLYDDPTQGHDQPLNQGDGAQQIPHPRHADEQELLSTDGVLGSDAPGTGRQGAAGGNINPRFQRARNCMANAMFLPRNLQRKCGTPRRYIPAAAGDVESQAERPKPNRHRNRFIDAVVRTYRPANSTTTDTIPGNGPAAAGDVESQAERPKPNGHRNRFINAVVRTYRPTNSTNDTKPKTTHHKREGPGRGDGRTRDTGPQPRGNHDLSSIRDRDKPTTSYNPDYPRASSPMTVVSMQANVSDATSHDNTPRAFPLPMKPSLDAGGRSPAVARFPREHRRRLHARFSVPETSPLPQKRVSSDISDGMRGSLSRRKQKQARIDGAQCGDDNYDDADADDAALLYQRHPQATGGPGQLDGESAMLMETRSDASQQDGKHSQANCGDGAVPPGAGSNVSSSWVSLFRPSSTNAVLNADPSSSRLLSQYHTRDPVFSEPNNGFHHSSSEPQLQSRTNRLSAQLVSLSRPQSSDGELAKNFARPTRATSRHDVFVSDQLCLPAKPSEDAAPAPTTGSPQASDHSAVAANDKRVRHEAEKPFPSPRAGHHHHSPISTGQGAARSAVDVQPGPLDSHPTTPRSNHSGNGVEREEGE